MLSVSGCRGIVGKSLTPETVSRFIGAAGRWLRSSGAGAANPGRVIVAGDGRLGGAALRGLAAQTLALAGFEVVDIGVATTPTVGVAVLHHGAAGGVTLTASHNPAEWNGVKVISSLGGAPGPADAAEIVRLYHAGEASWATPAGIGAVRTDATAARVHVERVLAALARCADLEAIRARRFRVVLNSVNASGAAGGRMLLEELGCALTHMHADTSGVFPHPPEPTADNLKGMSAAVAGAGADIGFAQDPDADRLAILDGAGRYIGEEYTLVLAARALIGAPAKGGGGGTTGSPVLVANLSTSRMLDDVAARFGARVQRSAVGEANVVDVMRRVRSPLGGEGNGGVIWPEIVPIRDSLGAMALTLALMTRERATLADLVADVPVYAIEKRKIELKPGLTERALRAAASMMTGPDVRIDTQDGVRLDFPVQGGAAWLHVRASNTEPILRLIAEAPQAVQARRVLDDAEAAISAA
ncbi:MAG: phosphoglucosamine mutase [Planctomycetota bacterium]|nr:phosphoglucosamine mutase [Planctomycetota bacterium]